MLCVSVWICADLEIVSVDKPHLHWNCCVIHIFYPQNLWERTEKMTNFAKKIVLIMPHNCWVFKMYRNSVTVWRNVYFQSERERASRIGYRFTHITFNLATKRRSKNFQIFTFAPIFLRSRKNGVLFQTCLSIPNDTCDFDDSVIVWWDFAKWFLIVYSRMVQILSRVCSQSCLSIGRLKSSSQLGEKRNSNNLTKSSEKQKNPNQNLQRSPI